MDLKGMSSLAEFLRARLEEDQWIAEGAAKANGMTWAATVTFPAHGSDSTDDHIARHDPARVLREVEAKREFLDFAVRTRDLAEQQPTEGQARELRVKWASYLTALKFDALRYADHPDYREEWKP